MGSRNSTESVWARGLSDTKRILHSPWFWALEVFGAGTIGAIFENPWAGLFTLILIIVVFWLVAVIRAPFQQRNEARQYIKQFEERPVVIQFDYNRDVVVHGNGESSTFRIEIKNDSPKVLQRIAVQIVGIVGDSEEATRSCQKYIGLRLAVTLDPIHQYRAPAEKPKDEITMAPGDRKLFDLFHVIHRGPSFTICHSTYERRPDAAHQEERGQPPIWQVPRGGNIGRRLEFTLRVVGENSIVSNEKRFIADATGESISFHEV